MQTHLLHLGLYTGREKSSLVIRMYKETMRRIADLTLQIGHIEQVIKESCNFDNESPASNRRLVIQEQKLDQLLPQLRREERRLERLTYRHFGLIELVKSEARIAYITAQLNDAEVQYADDDSSFAGQLRRQGEDRLQEEKDRHRSLLYAFVRQTRFNKRLKQFVRQKQEEHKKKQVA